MTADSSGATVVVSSNKQAESIRIRFDAEGNVIVDRARWEQWNAFICPDISPMEIPVNRGAHWDGPVDDTNFSYRTNISLKLRREDFEMGLFRPIVVGDPELSACVELHWKFIDPLLR